MAALFVTGDDLFARCDRREIAELASDDSAPVDDVALATNPNVLIALEDAEGEVIANLQAGGRYSAASLQLLSGSALKFLQRIICEIAMLHLYRRRPSWKPELLEAYKKLAELYLEKLSSGEAIFGGDPERLDASKPDFDGPTLTDHLNLNLISDRSGYFRPRVLPNGRNV